MNQTTDPMTLVLTGQLPFILLAATALALPVSFGLLKLYRRAVLKSMLTRTNQEMTDIEHSESSIRPNQPMQAKLDTVVIDHDSIITTGTAADALYSEAIRSPWRAAAIYTIAGFCYALVMAAAFLTASKIGLLPLRFLVIFWNYAWPVVLTVCLVAAVTRRAKLATVTIYSLVLVAIGAIALAMSPKLTWVQIAVLWLTTNLLPTILLLTFLNRRVRAVGPLVLTFMIVAVTGSQIAISFAAADEARLRLIVDLGLALGLKAHGIFIGLIFLGFLIFGIAGWLTLRFIRSIYERKKISDQSITLDAIWLLFGIVHSIGLAFEDALWILSGPSAFLIYKLAVYAGFSLLNRKKASNQKNPKLLLLRVFSLGRRSEQLFDALGTHWRYIGSIQFIAGPDLLAATIEPHEFLDFLSGKLARRFIDGPQTLNLRISEMDLRPDQDGRFRINDFFCYDDTWKTVLSRLASESDAVIMDLRGFSPQNAGCIFEINELINIVPLERVLFIIDNTTDEDFLRQTIQESWSRVRPDSPNRLTTSGKLRLFRFTGLHRAELEQLLRTVCVATSTPHLSTT